MIGALLSPTQGIALAFPVSFATAAPTVQQWTPAAMFPGWAEDGVNITVPIATFTAYNLTADIADGTTGDARQVLLSLLGAAYTWYNNLATPPEAMRVTIRRRSAFTSGSFTGKEQIDFTVSSYIEYPSGAVVAEPIN